MDKKTLFAVYEASRKAGCIVNGSGKKLTEANLDQMVKWNNEHIRSRELLHRYHVIEDDRFETEMADLRKVEIAIAEERSKHGV